MAGGIVSIGIDLIEIARIRATLERYGERFLRRVYTAGERQRVGLLQDPAPYLAGRFAAKEAVLKVLGTGLSGGIRWQDVEIRRVVSLRGQGGFGTGVRFVEYVGDAEAMISRLLENENLRQVRRR